MSHASAPKENEASEECEMKILSEDSELDSSDTKRVDTLRLETNSNLKPLSDEEYLEDVRQWEDLAAGD